MDKINKVEPGIYRHFKGNNYEVIGTARFTENPNIIFVVYKALYESKLNPDDIELPFGTMWVRPIESFTSLVDGIPRFTKL